MEISVVMPVYNEEENIIIGFDLSHSYDYMNTLDKELKSLQSGDKVKDFYNNQEDENN